MKRLALTAGLLACALPPSSVEARGTKRYLKKESTVDMTAPKTVFFGWVDMVPEDWAIHGYSQKGEWDTAINQLNNAFQRFAQTKWLAGRTVIGAKDVSDTNAAGPDLHIRFSDVRIDYDNYLLYLSIHFVDPQTHAEIASIPLRPYYGNDWGFEKYLRAALEEVDIKIQVEVTGVASKK